MPKAGGILLCSIEFELLLLLLLFLHNCCCIKFFPPLLIFPLLTFLPWQRTMFLLDYGLFDIDLTWLIY